MSITIPKRFSTWFKEYDKKRWQTRNGIKLSSKGYMMIHVPTHPHCNNQGYVMFHRLVMEEYLGRFLTKDEEVHHINGNPFHNLTSNLQVMSKSEHTRLHKTKKCKHYSKLS